MKSTVSLALLVATASAMAIPSQSSAGPFSLAILSPTEYNGTYVSGAIQGTAYTAATISQEADNTFYYEPETGILYHQVPIFGGSFGTDTSLSLAATFPKARLPGQHLKALTFQLEKDEEGTTQADVAMAFDTEGYLTHEGNKDVWYVCTNARNTNTGEKYTAIELLIGAKPFDPSCTKVDIKQVV
ncbi:hypothetical protein ABW20_dc0104145 [Dactylellina cionopaga]|nr:hypothetical protein ABW20_dc0104145 [Dactylellina cionopaga]